MILAYFSPLLSILAICLKIIGVSEANVMLLFALAFFLFPFCSLYAGVWGAHQLDEPILSKIGFAVLYTFLIGVANGISIYVVYFFYFNVFRMP